MVARAVPWLKLHWRLAPISHCFQDLRFVCCQVETDAKKLVSEVCGANYVTGTDPILIKVHIRDMKCFLTQLLYFLVLLL